MLLAAGTELGTHNILALRSVGGMGEVYQAHDTKLRRDVAIKVLPESFARDADRLARFRREAQLLAPLNHTNIATIYNIEDSNGTTYLVQPMPRKARSTFRLSHRKSPPHGDMQMATSSFQTH